MGRSAAPRAGHVRMESTRQTILEILRRRRRLTVDELTRELGLAPATIRRHLDILLRDGHIAVDQVRRETGRPHYVFSLTDAGEELFPKHYVRLTNRLIQEIVTLDPEETRGKSGAEIANMVFERMADRLADAYAVRVRGETLEERVESVTRILAEEGIVFDVEREADSFLLIGHGCPCRKVVDADHTQVCAHDERLLRRLLQADVEYVEPSCVDGDSYCAYRVRPAASPAASGAVQ